MRVCLLNRHNQITLVLCCFNEINTVFLISQGCIEISCCASDQFYSYYPGISGNL